MEQSDPQIVASNKSKLTWGIICLVGPTLLIVLSILAYAVFNFISNAGTSDGSDSPVSTIMNVLLFLAGAVATLTWLPGIIIGIILLSTRK